MEDFDIAKPHMGLLSDGSDEHKNALLANPIEAISVGGKLLAGWTTPPFPSVFSWATKPVTALSKQVAATGKQRAAAGKQQATTLKKGGNGDAQPDQAADGATANPAAVQLKMTPDEIKKQWRNWDARARDNLERIEKIPAGLKSAEHYDEIGSVLNSLREVLDMIDSGGYSKYLLRDMVSTGPFLPTISPD